MQKLILFITFLMMLIALLANPAPVAIEIEDLLLIFLPCVLGLCCLAVAPAPTFYRVESNLLIAVLLYLSYLLLSLLIGFVHGVSLLIALRSIGPYLNFFPLVLIGFLPSRFLNPWAVGFILVLVGLLQANYQIFLYLTHANSAINTLDVLRNRITLADPRTTLPIILSVAVLPLALISHKTNSSFQRFLLRSMIACLICLGLLGGMVTLTRAIVLSMLWGWALFFLLYLYQQLHLNKLSLSHLISRIFIYTLLWAVVIVLISFVPKIHMLEQGLFARFYHTPSFSTSTDYSNGRIYDEWIPAITTWLNSDIVSLFFGIGAGNTFIVATGEERTYIHNLCIYSLVYGGFFGLFSCLWLYFTVFKTLLVRARQTHQTIYLGFAALLSSLFFYGQLFAVHKGLAFNAMLFLLIALALYQPVQKNIIK